MRMHRNAEGQVQAPEYKDWAAGLAMTALNGLFLGLLLFTHAEHERLRRMPEGVELAAALIAYGKDGGSK